MVNKFMMKKSIIILFLMVLALSLLACTAKSKVKKPEGMYFNSEVDFGEGLSPVSDVFTDEYLDFNPNGSGIWKSSFDMDFKWKLKDESLTITRKVFNKNEVYDAIWDGEIILLDYDGTILLFEKIDD